MYAPEFDWREEPKRLTVSSILLLLVFLAAAGFMVGMAVYQPWMDHSGPPTMDARTYADRGLGPQAPAAPASAAQAAPAGH
ncbi:MAG: hypothetical protein E6J42_01075 [Chloroflexi bacterium]|nr:MAG: hypothetical protein E6J42_01075 [Chloroflexota bacterium]